MRLEQDQELPRSATSGHRGPIRQIDHLLVVTHDPDRLFQLFWKRFGLPPAVPPGFDVERALLEVQTNSGWWSGAGVSLGNIHLWFIRFEEGFEHLWKDSPWQPFETQSRQRARIEGLALEPIDVSRALESLDERGVEHGVPATHRYPHAVETTVDLPGFVDDNALVSLSSYEYPDGETRAGVHRRGMDALEESSGGFLRLHSVAELTIGAIDEAKEITLWKQLLSPLEPQGNRWSFPNGCAIRIERAGRNGVIGLKLRCNNVEEARNNLASVGLLADSGIESEAQVLPEALDGLDIRLVPLG